jgi:lipopolysaccharide transport protein LptA
MRQSNKQAVFSGNVKAWQVNNTLLAQELQVQGNGEVITARTNVTTTLYNAGTENRKIPVRSKSDQLVARRNDHRIELSGNVEINDDQRTMNGEQATFFFDNNRKIEHVEAMNKVVVVEKTANRKMTGDKMTYYLAKRMVYVDGNPATGVDPRGSISANQIVYDIARGLMTAGSAPASKTEIIYKQP